MSQLAQLIKELKSHANQGQAIVLQRFFKTGTGQYGEGDIFLGLKVPLTRQITKKHGDLPLADIQKLLNSEIHELRLAGLLILIDKYRLAGEPAAKAELVGFYLKNARQINNWDLVDLSVYKILGDFLLAQPTGKARRILDKLAVSDNIWERRMAMVSTFAFMKKGRTEETFRLAAKLLRDEHDLIHKAVGWMLREAGKRTGTVGLKKFLDKNHKSMPRTALRYALERLSPAEKKHYLLK